MIRVDGKQYKSLTFTVLRDDLVNRKKAQTYRVLFVPNYGIGEIVAIVFKREDKSKEFLYLAEIMEIYPRRLDELTTEEAILDGFKSVNEMVEEIKRLNHIKDIMHWGFIIRWKEWKKVTEMSEEIKKSKKWTGHYCEICNKRVMRDKKRGWVRTQKTRGRNWKFWHMDCYNEYNKPLFDKEMS